LIERPFSLKPFKHEDTSSDFNIAGKIGRDTGILIIRYELFGPLKELIIPISSDRHGRMDRLWKETCFELFLNINKTDNYWEFNLSPSENWNIYRFNAYRDGMREEKAFINLPFRVQTGPEILRLSLGFNVDKIVPPDQAINVGVCAVIKDISSRTTYWALDHHGERPDFHRKDSFIIEL